MPAEQYESAMDLFCANLIKRLKTIDKDNLDEVVDFIADAFYNLTEIHPYPNCNGRTATCFMNILLRYLEKPSILMRYPRERDNPESIYSKIFESNDVDMDLLKKHLKQRILDTQEKPFVHPLLKMLIDHRIALMFLLKRIEKNHPECDINQSYFKIINSLNPAVLMAIAAQQTEQLILLTQGQPDDPKNSDHLTAILSIQYVMAEVDKLEKRLNLEKAKSVPPTAANICKQLAAISGTDSSSWKAYQKSTVFIFESAVEADVVTAIDILNKEDTGCTISKLKRADNGRHVIKIEKINPLKLFSIDPDLRAAKSNDPEEHKGFAP